VRRSYVLVALAVTTLVALAFVIPLGLLVGTAAEDRALREAERQALGLSAVVVVATDRELVQNSIMSTRAGQDGRLAAHLPALGTVGTSKVSPADIDGVRNRQGATRIDVRGGLVYLRPVGLPEGKVAVIEVYVPAEARRAGVGTAWLVLIGEAIVPTGSPPGWSAPPVTWPAPRRASARACCTPGPNRAGRPRSRRWVPRSTASPTSSSNSWRPSGPWRRTCRTGCGCR
jgi:hypothetical protein